MARTEVLNTRRTRLMRRHVPKVENYTSICLTVALVVLVGWVFGTGDDYEADDRDLPVELLYDASQPIEIYTRPLKPWVEPGQTEFTGSFDFGLYPSEIVDDDWQATGRVRKFDADNLYEKINGEAEKFIKQGFVSLHYLVLRDNTDGAELAIELFDQGDIGGSLGIFADHGAGRELHESRGVTYFNTTAGVIGRTGQYFFRVAGDRESQRITAKAAQLIAAFSSLGSGVAVAEVDSVPAGFALLRDGLGLAEPDIQFQESNVFQYDFAGRFWFGNTDGDSKARLFVHIADSSGEAQTLLDLLDAEQRYEYAVEHTDSSWILYRHEFQRTYFVIARRGRFLYGGEKLPSAKSAEVLMERLEAVLDDD